MWSHKFFKFCIFIANWTNCLIGVVSCCCWVFSHWHICHWHIVLLFFRIHVNEQLMFFYLFWRRIWCEHFKFKYRWRRHFASNWLWLWYINRKFSWITWHMVMKKVITRTFSQTDFFCTFPIMNLKHHYSSEQCTFNLYWLKVLCRRFWWHNKNRIWRSLW